VGRRLSLGGQHPLPATRADTGEVLHARLRTGRANAVRGAARFADELADSGPIGTYQRHS
jgi:hypothetical protein